MIITNIRPERVGHNNGPRAMSVEQICPKIVPVHDQSSTEAGLAKGACGAQYVASEAY